MNRRSLFRSGIPLGFAICLTCNWQIANAETSNDAIDPVTNETAREAQPRPARPASAPKTTKDPLTQLESQIRDAKREREEAAQEHQLLKARLAEMEKKIQELMQQNAERDARLRAQSSPAK